MPLRIWLPLNGNYNNQGMCSSAATSGGGSFVTPGKLTEQCWSSSSKVLMIPYPYTSTNRITIAMWVKPNSATRWTDVFGFGSTTTANRIELSDATAGHTYTFYADSNGIIAGSTQITTALTNDAWHHIAMTADGSRLRFYLDGSKVYDGAQANTVSTAFGGANNIWVSGCGSRSAYNGYFNDFRVYDHALSLKEVAELAKGLMLHYPLYSPGDANPNLFSWTSDYTEATPYVHTSSAVDGYKTMGAPSLVTVTPGKVYYVQVKCDHAPKASHGGTGAPCDEFTFWFYIRNVGTSKSVGSYDNTVCFTSGSLYHSDPAHNLYVWKWTAPSNSQDITVRTNSYSEGTTPVTLKFWDFKLEEGTFTPYVPPSTAPQYTALGLSSDTVRDTSGMGNDTAEYGSPTSANGSPRYGTCTGFSGGSCLWPVPDPIKSTTTEFTISVWFNTITTTGNQCIWNGRATTGGPVAIFLIGNTLRVDDSVQTTSSTVSTNTWYHLAVTWKSGGNKVIYLNGSQATSVSAGNITKTSTKASIGRSSVADSLSSGNNFAGQMSDFRIYATALTAAQVKELYNAPASVADTGSCHAAELSEGASGISVEKTGVMSGNSLSVLPGKYDNNVIVEPDGSCWAHIVHHADPTTYKFASTDTFATGVWKDERRFFDASMCDLVDKWEFLLVQKADSSTATERYRWVQSKNPNTAAFADVAAALVTKKGSADGYSDIGSATGGIYKFNSNTYYCANNGTSGNWWGAIGAWNGHQGGIPGYNAVVVKDGGFQDLYLRIDNVTWTSGRTGCSFDRAGKGILATDFMEQ